MLILSRRLVRINNKMNHFSALKNFSHEKISFYFFLFTLVDLLFIPRPVSILSVPLSTALILLTLPWLTFNRKKLIIIIFLGVILLFSALLGTTEYQTKSLTEDTKRVVQLISILLYSIFAANCKIDEPAIKIIFRIFFIIIAISVSVFIISPEIYSTFIKSFYPEAQVLIDSNIMFGRFPYIFDDSNAAGYLIAMALATYTHYEKNISWLTLCTTAGMAAIFTTQSRGAYIALTIFAIASLINGLKNSKKEKIKSAILFILLSAAVILLITTYLEEQISTILESFENRFEQEDEIGGGRQGKYSYFFEQINLLPFGVGYNLVKDGVEFRPHSDLIRWNFSYGLLSLPLLLYFIAPKLKNQIPLFLIALIPFLVNTLIDDYRLLANYLIFHHLIFISKYQLHK